MAVVTITSLIKQKSIVTIFIATVILTQSICQVAVNSHWSLLRNEFKSRKRKEMTLSCVYILQKTLYWKSCVVLNFLQLQQRKCNTCAELLFSLVKALLCCLYLCCCGNNLKLFINTMINGSSLKIVRSSLFLDCQ